MATLTKKDKTEMRRDYFKPGDGQEHFKGANPSMSGEQILAALQAVEDWFNNERATLKTEMDTAAGVTMTNQQARILARAWLAWKNKRGG